LIFESTENCWKNKDILGQIRFPKDVDFGNIPIDNGVLTEGYFI